MHKVVWIQIVVVMVLRMADLVLAMVSRKDTKVQVRHMVIAGGILEAADTHMAGNYIQAAHRLGMGLVSQLRQLLLLDRVEVREQFFPQFFLPVLLQVPQLLLLL
jgi:hypothetical protein